MQDKKRWLTLQEIKDRFQIKDTRTITVKFAKMGLKFIKIGNKYRFDLKDIEEFEERLKEEEQEKLIQVYPIRKRTRCKTLNVDFEKKKKNLIDLKVV